MKKCVRRVKSVFFLTLNLIQIACCDNAGGKRNNCNGENRENHGNDFTDDSNRVDIPITDGFEDAEDS